jgi:hypothetical protein
MLEWVTTVPKVMDLGFRSPSDRHAEDPIRADQQKTPCRRNTHFGGTTMSSVSHEAKSMRETLNLRFEKPQFRLRKRIKDRRKRSSLCR